MKRIIILGLFLVGCQSSPVALATPEQVIGEAFLEIHGQGFLATPTVTPTEMPAATAVPTAIPTVAPTPAPTAKATVKPIVTPAPAPKRRVAVILGDSITGGLGTYYYTSPWPTLTGAILGWEVHNLAIPGTGYAAGPSTFLDRVPAALALHPDIVVVAGGVNDVVAPSIDGQANALFAALASVPSVFVLSPMPGQDGAGTYGNDARRVVGEVIRQAAAAHGRPYVDMLNPAWVNGTGTESAPTGDGNADLYIGPDTIHLNQAGEDFIGRALAQILY